ncbi:MAG: deoxyribonuclease IV [Candidatus Methylacidiphilales bacterium]
MQRLGAHTSIAGGVLRAIERTLSIGANAAQIFVKNNKQWMAPPFPEDEPEAFRREVERLGLWVCGHAGYLINPGAAHPETAAKSFASLLAELDRAEQLGLPFLVLHPGTNPGETEEEGLDAIAAFLNRAVAERPCAKVGIALECTAGQGRSLGHRFEHLAGLLDRMKVPARFGVCFDTAHVFAAGYDLASPTGYQQTWAEFDRWIGLERLWVIHCNDSKVPLGSRKDRHEHLGQGCLGPEAFRRLMRDRRLQAIPRILETPKDETLEDDRINLSRLRDWAARR